MADPDLPKLSYYVRKKTTLWIYLKMVLDITGFIG